MSFIHTTEFYVILAVIAAAIVALAARPQNRGAVKETLLPGELLPRTAADTGDGPSVTFTCTDSGRVIAVRRGLRDVTVSGTVSIAMIVKGYDIRIEERLSPGSAYNDPAATAMFTIDNLAPSEYYHIHYNSPATGLFAVFTFHTRPSVKATHPLHQ